MNETIRLGIIPLCTLLISHFFLPADFVLAQKESRDGGPVGIFETPNEYDQFMRGAKGAAYGPQGTPEMRAMIPMINDIVLEKPVGWTATEYGVEGSVLGLLADQNVRAELEMVDDQYEQLKQLNSSIQQRSAEQLKAIDFKSADWTQQLSGIRERASNELNSLLLPHQIDRLKQIRMHSQLRRRSFVDIITSDPVKSDLEISEDQTSRLRKAEKEIEEKLQKEIARLRAEARDKLLGELDSGQKAKVESMFGDVFEFEKNEKKRRGTKGKRKK